MDEAAPRGVHALSFASLAHKSFIKDVSFAYTEGRKAPPRTARKYRYKRLLLASAQGWEEAAGPSFVFVPHFVQLFFCFNSLLAAI